MSTWFKQSKTTITFQNQILMAVQEFEVETIVTHNYKIAENKIFFVCSCSLSLVVEDWKLCSKW